MDFIDGSTLPLVFLEEGQAIAMRLEIEDDGIENRIKGYVRGCNSRLELLFALEMSLDGLLLILV